MHWLNTTWELCWKNTPFTEEERNQMVQGIGSYCSLMSRFWKILLRTLDGKLPQLIFLLACRLRVPYSSSLDLCWKESFRKLRHRYARRHIDRFKIQICALDCVPKFVRIWTGRFCSPDQCSNKSVFCHTVLLHVIHGQFKIFKLTHCQEQGTA